MEITFIMLGSLNHKSWRRSFVKTPMMMLSAYLLFDCKNILMSTSVLPKASVDIDADDGNLGVSNYDYDQCSNSASHDNNDPDLRSPGS